MDLSILATAFAAFIGGLMVISRVVVWAAIVHMGFGSSRESRASISALFLHSGPWLLALAIVAVYYMANHAPPALLWATVSGLVAAMAFVVAVSVYAYLRRNQPRADSVPLTPERLAATRRRFFWGTSLTFGGLFAMFMIYFFWSVFSQSSLLIAFVLAISLCGGWLYSWFMWQWYGASLEAAERERLHKERQSAV